MTDTSQSSFAPASSSTEFERIGSDLVLDAPVNCVITFAHPEHGRAFLKTLANAVSTSHIQVLLPNRMHVIVTGNRDDVEALVRVEPNITNVAFQQKNN